LNAGCYWQGKSQLSEETALEIRVGFDETVSDLSVSFRREFRPLYAMLNGLYLIVLDLVDLFLVFELASESGCGLGVLSVAFSQLSGDCVSSLKT
jgi:hypothetical protein